eukprot:TRINITY_DN9348_c0_g1_i1.p1 TRINITY_DN9348_c0_g1~~TRINITY_DN9348_c0_g1_i1.p1  ORF type:complete len:383 (+),score=90.84 TRINITY_DN9348_c0_g1_i1:29-1150(+)
MKEFVDLKDYCLIDGSYKEGGGQIIRISIALSALLNKPTKIVNIRANRKNGGLALQHLTGVKLIAFLFQAKMEGDKLKSTELMFTPSENFTTVSSYVSDIKSAGSVALLIQIALPCLLFAPRFMEITFRGGTDAIKAPPISFTQHVFLPIAKMMKIAPEFKIMRRGFYPRGGGEVKLNIKPIQTISPITLTKRGDIEKITIHIFSNPKPLLNFNQTVKNELEKCFISKIENKDKVEIEYIEELLSKGYSDNEKGGGVLIVVKTTTNCYLGSSTLFEQKVLTDPKLIAKDCAQRMLDYLHSGCCVDEFIQDQLIIFMALANGKSEILTGKLELHTETAIRFCECMTGAKFVIKEISKDLFSVSCDGIGFKNQFL